MSSDTKRLKHLFEKYLHDNGNAEEVREFWQLFSELKESDPLKQQLWELWNKLENKTFTSSEKRETILQNVRMRAAKLEESPRPGIKRFPWHVAAASILCLLATGFYFLNKKSTGEKQVTIRKALIEKDIKPGGNKAVLILANGKKIILDSVNNGLLASQQNSRIIKLSNGLLKFQPSEVEGKQQAIQYNTISTPRGGQYQVILPDESKVWLNASSSIKFPTTFARGERRVEITGEAYFEVEPLSPNGNLRKPFIVHVNSLHGDLDVEVLGTHFNIKAYDDESTIKTTLLKGAVKVTTTNGQQAMLAPEEQAQLDQKGKMEVVKNVNTEEITAWKNNLFWFDDDDIETVMRQISRWYDVEVEIKGTISQHFTGSIPRDLMVSGVFEVLKRTGKINFVIEGKKIIVSP